MRRRSMVTAALLGAAALGWLLWPGGSLDDSAATAADAPVAAAPRAPSPAEAQVRAEPRIAAPRATDELLARAPVDVEARERFNERTRAFFANAAGMNAGSRLHEAQLLEQELARLEQAGGMSAGETLLVRAGFIRETVPAGAEQEAQLRALRQRYEAETQRRVALEQARSDPQFGSYKARESEIVDEVMAMETIPDGLSRNEYLRRRLQSAREHITP